MQWDAQNSCTTGQKARSSVCCEKLGVTAMPVLTPADCSKQMLPFLPFPLPFLPPPTSSSRCELPQRCLGRSLSRSRIWCILAFKYDIRWHHFGPTVVDTYAKPLVHYWPRTTYVLNCHKRAHMPLLRPWGGASQSGSGALYRTVNVYIYGNKIFDSFGGPVCPPPIGCATAWA